MKRSTEVRYAVACDGTVQRLRELAYRDGVRDARGVLETYIQTSVNPEGQTTAQHLLDKMRGLKRDYK